MYLNTYPISGALMVQYAAVCGKIPITFAEDWVHTDSDLSELFCEEIPVQIQFGNMDEMKRVLRRYLGENKELLRKDGEKLKNAVICKKSFQRILWKYLEGQGNQLVFEEYDIDIKRFSRSYIDRFNECRRNYYRCFLSKRHLSVNFRFRKYFFLYVFKVSN